MADSQPSAAPLEAVADTVGARTTEAFEILGNETRLAILVALWEAQDPGPPPSESTSPAVSFSDLQERVGMQDSGQFNYHLDKLVDTFVEQTEAGYTLTTPAERILRSVFAGTLVEPSTFTDEPIDAHCFRCGEPTVVDYSDSILTWRCTSCEGAFQPRDGPSGTLSRGYRPPVGLANRTPPEFHRHGNTWDRNRLESMVEGVCPDCSGAVNRTLYRCDNHDSSADTVCEHCHSLWEIQGWYVCDICKLAWRTAGWGAIFQELAVLSFFHEHGFDPSALYDESKHGVYQDAVEMTVRAEDPLEVAVTVEFDGDRLDVILNDEAHVLDVIEEPPQQTALVPSPECTL